MRRRAPGPHTQTPRRTLRDSTVPFRAPPENLQTISSGLQRCSKPFDLPAAKHVHPHPHTKRAVTSRNSAGQAEQPYGDRSGECGRRGRRLRHPWPGRERLLRRLGVVGRRHQRRRLRRYHHRGSPRGWPRQHTIQCRRQLRGVRQGLGLCGRDRPRRGCSRQRRLRPPWPGCGRSIRPFGVRGRRYQWRRLRRPHHRSTRWRWARQHAGWCWRQLRGVR